MKKHTILFLAANPSGTDRLALDREARAIQVELERSGYRDCLEFVTRWAAEPLDLLRELRKLKPTVVHFSGHGGQDMTVEHRPNQAPRRYVIGELGGKQGGLFFQGSDGRAQVVSTAALEETFGAAGASVKLVVLNACYSEPQAEALLAHIDCVVGMGGSIDDDAARNFAIGFYGGLGERESVIAAYKQGRAAISLAGLRDGDRPQLKVREGVDANQLAHADGNVLHAVMLHDALRDLPAPECRADRIPRGLKGLVGEIWDRAASHEGVRVGLGLLCAAQEALSLDVLAELAGWSYDEKDRFVRDARQLLLEEPASWAGVEAYRPRHDWVRELIAERLGVATLRAHHETLSRELATWPPPADATRRSYAVRHALAHRIAVDNWSGVRELASDLGYLEARAHAVDVFAVEQELREAGARCPDPDVARDLVDLARAMGRESHWIRDEPKEIAGLIWNRLRRSGWTAQDLETRITVPAEVSFLRVRHAASRESASLERTLDGHASWVRACAVTTDGRRVVSASDDGTLKVWGLDAGRGLATLSGHTNSVNACVVTPDDQRVVSASRDGTLKVWDFKRGCA